MKQVSGVLIILGLFVSSCNIPGTQAVDPGVATAAALTIQAVLTSSANIITPPAASPTVENSEVVKSTPTFSKTTASVGEVTNCRAGPGTDYERITQIFPNETVNIIGFYPPNYWIVSTKAGTCWLSGEFATPVGSLANVPTVAAPPTQKADVPEAATFSKNGWTFFCYGPGQADITLSWNDKADNETGYRVLKNGKIIAELPANSTNFAETIELLSGESVGYQIRAYNPAGEADSAIASMTCP